ncbi:hypothetical protein [Weissella viridescens]|uniref:hypothetical protein n=1 Tax=Weissella viridescens TaxID=1629 RepID=UPI003AF224B6
MTETERVANLNTINIIEVTPGWYIEEISDDSWWYHHYTKSSNDDLMIRSIKLTNNPISAEDFTGELGFAEAALRSFSSAKIVKLDINISKSKL